MQIEIINEIAAQRKNGAPFRKISEIIKERFNVSISHSKIAAMCKDTERGEAKEQGAAQEQGLEQIEPKNANKRNDNENSANEGAGRPIGFFGNDNTPVTAKQRMCDNCGEAYDYKHVKQKFCSNSCRVQSWNKKNRKELPSF